MKIEILPSLLAADLGRLAEETRRAEASGADALHIDIMDPHFVPNMSFGPSIVDFCRKTCPAFYRNVHLMMSRPDLYIEKFAAAEDEADLSKVYAKREYFEALAKGYLEGAKFLNEAERANLVFSGKLATFEVGIRFLADYLAGDVYFHTKYDDHNLVRARNQFQMVRSLEEQTADFEAIVKGLS